MNYELLQLAKSSLKELIIKENGEEYYFNLIAEKNEMDTRIQINWR